MGSVGNQVNPWAPYDNYRDCSQEICSIYCPQFCYLIFPPPPPSDDDGSTTPFSPLIIAIIGVLTSALVLVSYYAAVTRYCRKRRIDHGGDASFEENPDDPAHHHHHSHDGGLDENLIKTITVCRYQKGDGLIEGTECAVCLGEFRDDEPLRLLPKCSHAFHLPCIDTWLRSQPNCPLCRASVIVVAQPPPEDCVYPVHSSRASSSMEAYDVSSYQVQRPDDLVLVVDDRAADCRRDDAVMSFVGGSNEGSEDLENARRNDHKRSVSLGTFSSHRQQLLVSDILRIEEDDEDLNMGCSRGVGPSKGISGLIRSPLAMKRSVSAGRFVFNVRDKGSNTSVFLH